MNVKIILVDDNYEFRKALKFLLQKIEGVEIIGEASNGYEFLDILDHLEPDMVLMDIEMPEMNGIEATRRANKKYPDLKIIGLSYHEDLQNVQDLMSAGAQNFIFKNKLNIDILENLMF